MGKSLNVLLVEDSEDDAAFVLRELKRSDYDIHWQRVETPEAMNEALDRRRWDVILSDYHMPRFSAPEAFRLVKGRGIDIPFIIISGTVGEEVAVEAMRVGVHDYLLKGMLTRLMPAIERELREAALRAEQRKMQEQLLISDRMASVGTLAAGVAHEINNPLAALIANLEFSLEEVDKLETGHARSAEIKAPLQEAAEAADRVRMIVRDLKVFSRSGDEERRGPVDLKQVLESSLRMAWNEIRHRARLERDYGEIPPAWGNESRLGQVFLNLLINSAQALPEGRSETNEIRVVTRAHDNKVVVEVRDTGTGIPPEVLPKIFDPFFTTKPAGVGTGLGLAICHKIVTGLGGTIEADSKPGAGTVFKVTLPTRPTNPERSTTSTSLPAVAPAQRGRGKVLVIDDEPMINSILKRMLGKDHEVECAGSVREALDRMKKGERFDLIMCDLMMPEMTGMDLHAELQRTDPALAERLVFMTGGAFTPAAREFLDRVPNARVEKPFEVQNLRSLIQTLLPR
ncbi:MAG TPA: response regulator [Polyangia bacterium]|nr:response regulator [Polyangia bacterium]